jgi:cellulose synthase/poly-beta-1,6-N-acetylglucosamine synthase-like glycosyltransferase
LIYTAIAYTVANGEMAPFVGHNAILRWKALQEVAYFDEDQYVKFWSECSVSEDFDMSLRLQSLGYTIRLANYTGDGFKEGVSLTVYDELARWEKYAYGCSEMLFNPIRLWPIRGPFTPVICKFLISGTPLATKLSTLGYMGTYFAISSAWITVLVNYFLVGWFNGYLDHWYTDSFRIYFGILFIFACVSNIALAVLKYRIGSKSLIKACKSCNGSDFLGTY